MSRYLIPVEDRPSVAEFVVGWDPPLGTFFAQEFDHEIELLWSVGYMPREIKTIGELRLVCIARGVVIPRDVDDKLIADEQAPWTPGPLQRALGFTGKEEQ